MARHDSGERKKASSTLKVKYGQIIYVTPGASIGTNYSPYPIASGIKYTVQNAFNELNPIGSYILSINGFSNADLVAVSTSSASFITISNYPLLQAYLPPRQTSITYSFATTTTHYEWLYCAAVDKWVQFISGSTTINVFTGSTWPSSPVAKTSPFTMGAAASVYPCVVSTYGNGKLVALNRNGAGTSNLGMVSSDLSTFTQFTFPATGSYPNITWNGTVYCASMYVSSVSYVYTSSNGTTFTQTANLGNLGEVLLASSTAGVIAAVQQNGSAFYISTNNGTTFTSITLPVSSSWSDICYDALNNQFALVSSNYICLISTAGVVTAYYSVSFPSAPRIRSVDQGLVIGYNTGGSVLLFSRDGKSWGMLYSSRKDIGSYYTYFYNVYSDGTNIIFRYRRNASSDYFDSDKVVLSTTELEIQPISAPVSGTQYFLRGK